MCLWKKSNIANFLTKNTPSNGNSRLNTNTLSNYNFMDKKHPTRLKNWEFRLRTLIYAYKKLFLLIKIRFKAKKLFLRELSCTYDGTLCSRKKSEKNIDPIFHSPKNPFFSCFLAEIYSFFSFRISGSVKFEGL